MAREPDRGGAFVFDLVDDDVVDHQESWPDASAGDGPDGDRPGAGEPPPSDGSGWVLRAAAPVAAILAIVMGTGLGVDGMRDVARMERMRDAHGGVVDVSSPVTERWTWEGAVGSRSAMDEGLMTQIAVLDGVLAFQSDGELVGLDPGTGAEAWVVPLGADPVCGPMGSAVWGEVATRNLVCLAGSGTDRAATVIGPDGVPSAARTLDARDTRRYGEARPGPDGTVLRAKRSGRDPAGGLGDAVCTDQGECTGTVEAGRDLVLRAEDALTGEERWHQTIPFRPTPADRCANWYGTSWDGSGNFVDLEDMLDTSAFGARISDGLVQLYGCGVASAVTASGVVVGAEIEPGAGSVSTLRTGGYIAHTFDGASNRTVLYADDGEPVGEIDGYVIGPDAEDGSGPGTLLGFGEASQVRAYEPDGGLRWDVAAQAGAQMFLAEVAGTAVILTSPGTVRGLDLMTGEERWVWDGSGAGAEQYGDLYVARGFTDGRSVLLLTEHLDGGAALVSLDATTGDVIWEQNGDETPIDATALRNGAALVAVDGSLLRVARDGISRLG